MDVAIVGGGISGLAAAHALQTEAERRGTPLQLTLVEAEGRLGGKCDTRQRDGFLVEAAVNGWLSSKVPAERLVEHLGLQDQRLEASRAAQRRFVMLDGRLVQLPSGPGSFVRSPLLTARGKLRVMGELFVRRGPDAEESVADFARRRLGEEVVARLVDPMVSGIFAGDVEQLSLPSAFPLMQRAERDHGSLIRAMFRGRGPMGRLVSLQRGVQQLTETLRARLNAQVLAGCEVNRISRTGGTFALHLADGRRIGAEKVVCATPSYATARLVTDLHGPLADALVTIPYAHVVIVAQAWPAAAMAQHVDSFGFLVPGREGSAVLGMLCDSSIFVGRAPEGYVLTRTILAGARHPEVMHWSDDDVMQYALALVCKALRVEVSPVWQWVIRHANGIPQYNVGHGARVAQVMARAAEVPGLVLTGNAYRGVSLSDCIGAAPAVAEAVLGGGV